MTEAGALLEALKRVLRRQKITYARVAEHLALSEASVKRLFTRGGFTLERLEAVCALAEVSMAELVALAADKPGVLTRLTPDQEQRLVADPALLLVAFLAVNGFSLRQMRDLYRLEEGELVARLLQLDKLGMIALLPGNRIRRLVSRHFTWHPDGPVQRYFERQMRRDFLDSRFDQPAEHLRFSGAMLSRDGITRMQQAIDGLLARFDELAQADADLPIGEKFGVGLLLAARPWEIPDFAGYRRAPRTLPTWD